MIKRLRKFAPKALCVMAALCASMCASIASAEELRYVMSKKADLLLEPKFGAAVVATATQGKQLTLLEQQGSWLRVGFGDARGWVSRLLVGPNPPLEKVSALGQLDEAATSNVRRRASDVTAAGATRGLTAEDRRRASQEDAADFEALSRIEAWRIDDREVETFSSAIRGAP